MNAVIWIVQVLVAFLNGAGGAYKLFQFDKIAAMPAVAALPKAAWTLLAGVEIVCAVLLILPVISRSAMRVAVAAALVLAVEGAALTGLYIGKGGWQGWKPENPAVWSITMGAAALLVALARSGRR